MKSFLSLLVALAVVCVVALPASAQPTDNGPRVIAHHAAAIAPASDDGTPALVYVLIGLGGAAALGAGGFLGARSVARRTSLPAS